ACSRSCQCTPGPTRPQNKRPAPLPEGAGLAVNRAVFEQLYLERRAAAAGGLDLRVFELEAGRFESLEIVDGAALKVHERGSVNEDLEVAEAVNLVHHARLIFEGHGILEARAASADHANAQPCRQGIMGSHNLPHLVDSIGGDYKRRLFGGLFRGRNAGGCSGHEISSPKLISPFS